LSLSFTSRMPEASFVLREKSVAFEPTERAIVC
jgi:hypothetical protein